jgi:hypothetical protein
MLSRVFGFGRRPFDSLSEQEIIALAISSEEDDGRIYRAYADGLRDDFPASAAVFDGMADEEDRHRAALIELHRKRFGERIPLIRREHVKGYYERKPAYQEALRGTYDPGLRGRSDQQQHQQGVGDLTALLAQPGQETARPQGLEVLVAQERSTLGPAVRLRLRLHGQRRPPG